MTVIAFDLDGTLSNPAQGITASLNYALTRLGALERDSNELTSYIGPPLTSIFTDLLNTAEASIIREAIGHYRDRYNSIGYRENLLYDGIRDLLDALTADDRKLYVATGKGPEIARAVVEYFELQHYFTGILECGLRRQKHELLEEILETEGDCTLVMVGDRSHDILAGKAVGARTVGVKWGFGSVEELERAGTDLLATSPSQLTTCIERLALLGE
ncbi:MAG: HAD-IA family hydrolase [Cyanobacteria bacterium P01_E01_bin.34]